MSIYIKGIDMQTGEGNKLVLQIFPNGEVYDCCNTCGQDNVEDWLLQEVSE